jgi:uncharacterized membrane protein YphA (DoxX/SURF4 family)
LADHAQVALTTDAVQSAEFAAVPQSESPAPVEHWGLATRIAFRFCVAYFTLFSLSNQILDGLFQIPKVNIPELSGLWPLRHITFWTAAHIFRIKHDLVYTGSGSGDKTFDWVLAFCLLVLAAVITLVWSILDRRRPNYVTFHKWFRLALPSEMFLYGFAKVIPLQMPFPYLARLLEPYGNFSPMAVLWSSIGASRSYEIFAGCAETLGGILLLTPRTTTLGALVCLADMIQVFMLNMTYDVPVKLFSFHLILFSLFLLAPDARRMIDFFFTDRAADPSRQPALFRSARANRLAVIIQVAFGMYLLGMGVYSGIQAWHTYGGARPKPALYGIWNVDEMSVDGQPRAPLFTDKDRWRHQVEMKLKLMDRDKFTLVNRGFHWINEYPYQR